MYDEVASPETKIVKENAKEKYKENANENYEGNVNKKYKENANENYKKNANDNYKENANENNKENANENYKANANENYKENAKEDLANQKKNDRVTADQPGNEYRISIENGSAKWLDYETEDTLQNINIKVRPGELIAIVGQVGAGKSSLMNVILKELRLQQGSIQVCVQSLFDDNVKLNKPE